MTIVTHLKERYTGADAAEIVRKMSDAARHQSGSPSDYMTDVARRAFEQFRVIIRAGDAELFLADLIRAGLAAREE